MHVRDLCSSSGHVVALESPLDGAKPRTNYLSCRDEHARCSLAASTVDEQVACGSIAGTVSTWDLSTNFAKDHCRAGVRCDAWLRIAQCLGLHAYEQKACVGLGMHARFGSA